MRSNWIFLSPNTPQPKLSRNIMLRKKEWRGKKNDIQTLAHITLWKCRNVRKNIDGVKLILRQLTHLPFKPACIKKVLQNQKKSCYARWLRVASWNAIGCRLSPVYGVGGRFSNEAANVVRSLAHARARSAPVHLKQAHNRSLRLTLVGHFGTCGHARLRIQPPPRLLFRGSQLLAPLMGGRPSSVTLCRTPGHPLRHPVLAHRPRASGLFVAVSVDLPVDFAPNNPNTCGDRPV